MSEATRSGSEELVSQVGGNSDHEVNEFVLAGDGNSLGRVDTDDPEAAVNGNETLIMSLAFRTGKPCLTSNRVFVLPPVVLT